MSIGGAVFGRRAKAASAGQRKFTLDLNCGSIGVQADQRQAIGLAHRFGFESLSPDPHYVAQLSAASRRELLAEMKQKDRFDHVIISGTKDEDWQRVHAIYQSAQEK